ncbi:MAG: arsenate reductase ArsC [Bacillota bacterium]|nr:arsenate reductase ArsC [Bacillota bacterium]
MNVLFVCTANSARSQMAEGLARHKGLWDRVASAGTMPTQVNPIAVEAMREIGVDISSHYSKPLTRDLMEWADVIITLCGDARDSCPVLPPGKRHLHWGFPDPAAVPGDHEARLISFREVRDAISARLDADTIG